MLSDDFSVATAVTDAGPGLFRADIPDGWQQGRGAFGGLVLGALARAVERSEEDPARTLRVLTGEVLGPSQPGVADVEVEALRRGTGMSTWEAWLRQGDEVQARATVILGRTRVTDADALEIVPPEMPPWAGVEVVPIGPPMGPRFGEKYEYRSTGPSPFAAGERSGAEGWVRLRRPVALGAPEVVGLMDAYWPARFARDGGPRPMATVAFTFELFTDPAALDPSEPIFYRAVGVAGRGGYEVEFRELWTARRALVALNQQTFAIIK